MTLTPEQQYQQSWLERQDYADRMQPIIGSLYRNHGIEICIYGRPLVSASAIDIIKAHKTVTKYENLTLQGSGNVTLVGITVDTVTITGSGNYFFENCDIKGTFSASRVLYCPSNLCVNSTSECFTNKFSFISLS